MGLRFRKSKKFGPFRINLSGSGVGWSVGGKHFRYTQPAKGKAYTTTTIPGTGISSRSTVQSSPSVGEPSRIPIPPIDSLSAPPSRSGTLRPLLIGLLTGGLIIAGIRFAGSLSGYTDENMIPPPPDRTVSAPADPETEAAVPSAPETTETAVTLSAPEAEKIPEATPPEDPAPTEIPAGVVTVEKEQPAETTLEEWFALMEERTRHTPAYPEEDETTLDEWFAKVEAEAAGTARWYTVNTSTKKIHNDWCKEVQKIKPENIDYTDTPGELLADGYTWCEKCHKQ